MMHVFSIVGVYPFDGRDGTHYFWMCFNLHVFELTITFQTCTKIWLLKQNVYGINTWHYYMVGVYLSGGTRNIFIFAVQTCALDKSCPKSWHNLSQRYKHEGNRQSCAFWHTGIEDQALCERRQVVALGEAGSIRRVCALERRFLSCDDVDTSDKNTTQ